MPELIVPYHDLELLPLTGVAAGLLFAHFGWTMDHRPFARS